MLTTVADATAVNLLLAFVLDRKPDGHDRPTTDQARDAAVHLADAAAKRLMAGLGGEDVRQTWPDHPMCLNGTRR
jgi:hypothetical protein